MGTARLATGTERRQELLERLANRTLRVAVLLGGFSSEREVSLRSGKAVADALASAGFPTTRIDVTSERLEGLDADAVDVAFLALHGRFGEDGGVQAALEARGLVYTGSGVEASRVAMDKVASKERFRAAGVPTADWAVISAPVSKLALPLPLPVVVKPRAEGSSVGVSIVRAEGDYAAAVAKAVKLGGEALVERFVPGREMTVGILGERRLPVIELRPVREFFDFEAKYQDTRTGYIVDPPLALEERRAVQEAAWAAHEALGCRGMSRVDVILGPQGPVVLEVNTIPGLTERSLLPKAAGAAGMDFAALCAEILRLAIVA